MKGAPMLAYVIALAVSLMIGYHLDFRSDQRALVRTHLHTQTCRPRVLVGASLVVAVALVVVVLAVGAVVAA
jgi:hypothetical protein